MIYQVRRKVASMNSWATTRATRRFRSSLHLLLCALIAVSAMLSCKRNELQVQEERLMAIWSLLREEMFKSDRFPKSFSDLPRPINPEIFLAIDSEKAVSDWSRIEVWTDYIYIGNQEPSVPSCALVISPPENHRNGIGHVLLSGGEVIQMNSTQIKSLIADPLLLAPAEKETFPQYRLKLSIRIPEKFQDKYGTSKDAPND
ncbi:MAG: hypothetical protein AB1813_18640 [Verrucomicrobiota bacterium]